MNIVEQVRADLETVSIADYSILITHNEVNVYGDKNTLWKIKECLKDKDYPDYTVFVWERPIAVAYKETV